MPRAAPLFAAALLIASLPNTAWAGWSRLRTEHFVFIGDASDGAIRRVAQKLDQFREVLTRALPGAGTTSPVPTIVIVFRNDSSFRPYKPLFQGRPIELAGFFQGADDVNYIAVNGEATEPAFHTIFHEYTHFLVSNTAGNVPLWIGEGLAELYATFEERKGGAAAVLGAPDVGHVALLRHSTLMSLGELMAVDHTSPVYNEGDRRSVFYAQSWALMHYLLLGNKARMPQIRPYLDKLRDGASPEQAFRGAFGDAAALERELNAYIRRYSFLAARFDFGEKVTGTKSEHSEPIDEAEAGAYLGDLLARSHRADDARAHFRKLIASNPQSARAAYGLGRLELEAGHLDEALPLLERAVAIDANEAAYQTALGRALLAKWDEDKTDSAGEEALRRARTVLSRSVELDPKAVLNVVTLGRAELAAGTDLTRAASLLEQAVRLAPSREYYRLLLASCLAAQREFVRARAYLGLLMARGSPEVRDAARDLMGRMAAVSAEPSDRAPTRADGRVSDTIDSPARPAPRDAAPQPKFVPVLRTVGPGETRVLGLFTAVECRRDGVIFNVTVDDRLLHFSASKFEEVDFITYRADSPDSVRCGAIQPPSRILATYRVPDAPVGHGAADGRLVAIELLPDGYTPQ